MSENLRDYQAKLSMQQDIAEEIHQNAIKGVPLPENPAEKHAWLEFSRAMSQIQAVDIVHTPTITEEEFIRFLLPAIDAFSKGDPKANIRI